jgi:MFS family permease
VLQSVASLARIIGPALGGMLLERDLNNLAALYGRTPFWTGGAIMLLAAGLALTVSTPAADAEERNSPPVAHRGEEA